MSTYEDRGNPVGQMGLYVKGETPGCSSLVAGRFIVDPGKSPHPPHVHDDEEVLIVESGHGEIICDGKTTKVGPGSMMYSTPNVAHGWKETVVFGFDGSRTAFDAIRKGGLKATILQDPLEQGKKAVETMVAHLRGQSLDPEIITPCG